jgi:hypothetical protein
MKRNQVVRSAASAIPIPVGTKIARGWVMLFLLACVSIPLTSNAFGQAHVPPPGTRFSLSLVGYNYTSRYIDTFSVNGQGGGNLYVSGPTSGGGGSICCISYVQGRPAGEVTVRWQSSGCMFRVPGQLSDGRTHTSHNFFSEIRVKVDPRIPARPQNFEVHFYPDGHIEAAITDTYSSPRLVYSESREDRSDFPRCPNETEPTK